MIKIRRNRKRKSGRFVITVIPFMLIFIALFLYRDIIFNNEEKRSIEDGIETNQNEDLQPSVEIPEEETPIDYPEEESHEEVDPPVDYSNVWSLILVNKYNLLPEDFSIQTSKVQGKYEMDDRAAENAKNMIADAKSAGIDLLLCSAYRDVETQERLYKNKIEEHKNKGLNEEEAIAVAGTIVAKPRTSEHHTGLAIDIVTPSYQNLNSGFDKTAAFAWLDANAHKFGFILRYPKDKQEITNIIYEPWHYRYVGTEYSYEIKEKSICLEEFLDKIN